MKIMQTRFNLPARLGVIAMATLFTQQALAAGTDPGVSVENTATVDYSVNSTPQATLSSNTTEFLVDRRVLFSVDQVGGALTTVTPGQNGVFIEFLVSNLSNGLLDFNLADLQLTSADGDVRGAGTTDSDIDMNNVTISVSAAADPTPGAGDGPAPVLGGPTVIDDLDEDQSIRVRVFADTPAAFGNGDIANIRLDVTAADPTTGVDLVASGVWDPAVIDNVFADAGNDGIESASDGFETVSADLLVSKAQAVISDPFGSGLAVPGARIEYTITLDNTGGAVDATDLVVTDDIDADVTFVADAYNGGAANISFDGGASFCVADAADADADGCALDGSQLTIQGPAGSPISVGLGASTTISFVVEVPTT